MALGAKRLRVVFAEGCRDTDPCSQVDGFQHPGRGTHRFGGF